MEEYKKLVWSRHNPRSEGKLLEQASIDFADYHNDIFNLHINEIDPVHQIEEIRALVDESALFLPTEMPTDPRTGQKVQELEIACNKSLLLFNKFPSGSVLTRDEHQHCLTVQNRINMRLPFTTAKEKKNYARYLELMGKLAPEKEMFDSFVKNYFNTNLLRRKQTIEPELNSLVVKIWQEKVRERLALERELGGQYVLTTVVPFYGCVENETNVTFEPSTGVEVHETGTVRNLFTENVLRCVTLKRNERVLENFTAEWCTVRCKRDEQMVNIRAVLQQLPDVAFVMPAGAFTLLLNYAQNTQEQWTIPFEIKLIDGRKVLIMDSRHPPNKLTTHARKVKAYKLLVKSFMAFKERKQLPESAKCPVKDGEKPADQPFRPLAFDEYMKEMAHRNVSSAKERIRESRFYQAWKLKEQIADEQHHLLVGFRQDCYESFRKMRVFINISVKIEYQPEFGAEQMTLAELLQEWCRQLLRPNSKTMRLRINSTTSSIISHRYLELRDIEEELHRLYSVKPCNLITNVWKMLKLMGNFPTGHYLLQRDGKSTQGPSVYGRKVVEKPGQSSPGTGVCLNWSDLLGQIQYDCPPLEQYDWIPIDRFVVTQLHRVNTLFPCSFPHWTSVRMLNTRQSQMKAKPVETKPVGKKKASPQKATPTAVSVKVLTQAQLMRREKVKLRKKLARQQKLKAEQIQQSLNQFAPYAGSAKPGEPMAGEAVPLQDTLMATTCGPESVDYNAYVEQAAINPDAKE
uniref:Little elongation complex subunit 2 C-terminal domain-containing protein n=1 Tax=Anopheles stephensi TaxID=30069 RepID=A0A182YPF8_ANOST